MKKRLKYPNIKSDKKLLTKLQGNGDISSFRAFYGDGTFRIDTGGVMPAGIQIEYKGKVRVWGKAQGYEYHVGKKTIVIFSPAYDVQYQDIIFNYQGNFIPTKAMCVDWNTNALTTSPTNDKSEKWKDWGGSLVDATDVTISSHGNTTTSIWKNLGSNWKAYRQSDVVGRIPRKSK